MFAPKAAMSSPLLRKAQSRVLVDLWPGSQLLQKLRARSRGSLWVNLNGKKTSIVDFLVRGGRYRLLLFNDAAGDPNSHQRERKKKRPGLWGHYSPYVPDLNWGLRYRSEYTREEHQKVILPKLFRRLVNSSVNQRAGCFHDNFRQYLKVTGDDCCLNDDFLRHGDDAKRYTIEELLPRGRLEVEPHQLVFIESSSPCRWSSFSHLNVTLNLPFVLDVEALVPKPKKGQPSPSQ
jgi:hypothetical protein